ncbi:MAG: Holliday junction resolvase RuvX [Patescibacteria group bacterium]|nr:Holliday junction resolvase RuvX [Patescibacteria group bacterium]
MKYLGLDIGERTVGVAGSDSGIVAAPLAPLSMGPSFMSDLGKVIEEERPEVVVFGIPTHADGHENGLARDIHKLAEGVAHEFNVTVDFADEYGTTIEAEKRLKEAGISTRDLKKYDDSLAAALILENYFASTK